MYVHGRADEYELANNTETVDSRGYSRLLAQFSISLRPVCPFVFNFAMMLATLITLVFLHPRSEFNGASFLFRNVVISMGIIGRFKFFPNSINRIIRQAQKDDLFLIDLPRLALNSTYFISSHVIRIVVASTMIRCI